MIGRVGTLLGRVIGATMVFGAMVVALFPRTAIVALSTPLVLVTLVTVVAVTLLAPMPRWLGRLAASRWTAPTVALSGGAVATALGELLRYPYGWDAAVIMSIAHAVDSGAALPVWRYRYLSLYPNNFPLLALDRMYVSLGSSLGLSGDAVGVAVNGVCLAATLWLTFDVVRRLAGATPALVASGFVMAFVGFSPWMAVPYTDLYAMPFLAAVPALAQRAWARQGPRALTWWALAGASAGVAYLVKTTPAVILVALVLAALLRPARGARTPQGNTREATPAPEPLRGLRQLVPPRGQRAARLARARLHTAAAVLGLLAAFFATSAVGTAAARSGSGVDLTRLQSAQSPPVLWWVADGMNEIQVGGHTRWGAYDREMVNAIAGRTQADMDSYARSYIAARWQERGLVGMSAFYLDKTVWNWSDASFWAWGEGIDSLERPLATATGAVGLSADLARELSQVNAPQGPYYRERMSVAQGLWIALLLLGGLGLLRAPVTGDLLLLALATVGIGAFILVFQGRSRYLLTFVPIIVALCCSTLPSLPWRWRRRSASHPVPESERRASGRPR